MSLITKNKMRFNTLQAIAECHDAPILVQENFDIGIFVSSWDARCTAPLTTRNLKFKHTILITFDDHISKPSATTDVLYSHLNEISSSVIVLVTSASRVESLAQRLITEVYEIYKSSRRTINVFIDISAMSRYHFGALIGFCFRSGVTSQIVASYSEAKYTNSLNEVAFTSGNWKTLQIPGFEGSYKPAKERAYIVSVGFEGSKTHRVLSRAEPNVVKVLFPSPGFDAGYPEETFTRNSGLFEAFNIKRHELINCHAGDAISVFTAAKEAMSALAPRYNVFCVCSGTKPHSLGLVLAALVENSSVLLYNIPEEYVKLSMHPTGRIWTYRISNLSAI